jgi:hypothetical protein
MVQFSVNPYFHFSNVRVIGLCQSEHLGTDVAALPMRNTDRKVEPAWKYLMKEGRHHVKMKWLNRKKDYIIRINDIMYYSEKKEHDRFYFNK